MKFHRDFLELIDKNAPNPSHTALAKLQLEIMNNP